MHIRSHLIYEKHFLIVVSTLQNRTQNKGTVLVFDEHLIITENLINEFKYQLMRAVLDKTLDDSATIFMHWVVQNIAINLLNKSLVKISRFKVFDPNEYLLNNMIAIEIER